MGLSAGVLQDVSVETPISAGWTATATVGAAVGIVSASALSRRRARPEMDKDSPAGISSSVVSTPVGKGGFVGSANGESFAVVSRCPKTGRAHTQQVRATTAMAAGPSTKTAINVGSMGTKTAAHLLKYDTVLGTLKADVSFTDDSITVDGKVFKVVTGRDPAAMPWKDLNVEVIIESTGAFNSLEGGSKHLDAGAKKVVLTAPGKNCPTYVVGVNEDDYDAEKDTVVSNASCTTNGMASVCKVLDESFDVQYGMMTTTHSYTGDQMILDGRH